MTERQVYFVCPYAFPATQHRGVRKFPLILTNNRIIVPAIDLAAISGKVPMDISPDESSSSDEKKRRLDMCHSLCILSAIGQLGFESTRMAEPDLVRSRFFLEDEGYNLFYMARDGLSLAVSSAMSALFQTSPNASALEREKALRFVVANWFARLVTATEILSTNQLDDMKPHGEDGPLAMVYKRLEHCVDKARYAFENGRTTMRASSEFVFRSFFVDPDLYKNLLFGVLTESFDVHYPKSVLNDPVFRAKEMKLVRENDEESFVAQATKVLAKWQLEARPSQTVKCLIPDVELVVMQWLSKDPVSFTPTSLPTSAFPPSRPSAFLGAHIVGTSPFHLSSQLETKFLSIVCNLHDSVMVIKQEGKNPESPFVFSENKSLKSIKSLDPAKLRLISLVGPMAYPLADATQFYAALTLRRCMFAVDPESSLLPAPGSKERKSTDVLDTQAFLRSQFPETAICIEVGSNAATSTWMPSFMVICDVISTDKTVPKTVRGTIAKIGNKKQQRATATLRFCCESRILDHESAASVAHAKLFATKKTFDAMTGIELFREYDFDAGNIPGDNVPFFRLASAAALNELDYDLLIEPLNMILGNIVMPQSASSSGMSSTFTPDKTEWSFANDASEASEKRTERQRHMFKDYLLTVMLSWGARNFTNSNGDVDFMRAFELIRIAITPKMVYIKELRDFAKEVPFVLDDVKKGLKKAAANAKAQQEKMDRELRDSEIYADDYDEEKKAAKTAPDDDDVSVGSDSGGGSGSGGDGDDVKRGGETDNEEDEDKDTAMPSLSAKGRQRVKSESYMSGAPHVGSPDIESGHIPVDDRHGFRYPLNESYVQEYMEVEIARRLLEFDPNQQVKLGAEFSIPMRASLDFTTALFAFYIDAVTVALGSEAPIVYWQRHADQAQAQIELIETTWSKTPNKPIVFTSKYSLFAGTGNKAMQMIEDTMDLVGLETVDSEEYPGQTRNDFEKILKGKKDTDMRMLRSKINSTYLFDDADFYIRALIASLSLKLDMLTKGMNDLAVFSQDDEDVEEDVEADEETKKKQKPKSAIGPQINFESDTKLRREPTSSESESKTFSKNSIYSPTGDFGSNDVKVVRMIERDWKSRLETVRHIYKSRFKARSKEDTLELDQIAALRAIETTCKRCDAECLVRMIEYFGMMGDDKGDKKAGKGDKKAKSEPPGWVNELVELVRQGIRSCWRKSGLKKRKTAEDILEGKSGQTFFAEYMVWNLILNDEKAKTHSFYPWLVILSDFHFEETMYIIARSPTIKATDEIRLLSDDNWVPAKLENKGKTKDNRQWKSRVWALVRKFIESVVTCADAPIWPRFSELEQKKAAWYKSVYDGTISKIVRHRDITKAQQAETKERKDDSDDAEAKIDPSIVRAIGLFKSLEKRFQEVTLNVSNIKGTMILQATGDEIAGTAKSDKKLKNTVIKVVPADGKRTMELTDIASSVAESLVGILIKRKDRFALFAAHLTAIGKNRSLCAELVRPLFDNATMLIRLSTTLRTNTRFVDLPGSRKRIDKWYGAWADIVNIGARPLLYGILDSVPLLSVIPLKIAQELATADEINRYIRNKKDSHVGSSGLKHKWNRANLKLRAEAVAREFDRVYNESDKLRTFVGSMEVFHTASQNAVLRLPISSIWRRSYVGVQGSTSVSFGVLPFGIQNKPDDSSFRSFFEYNEMKTNEYKIKADQETGKEYRRFGANHALTHAIRNMLRVMQLPLSNKDPSLDPSLDDTSPGALNGLFASANSHENKGVAALDRKQMDMDLKEMADKKWTDLDKNKLKSLAQARDKRGLFQMGKFGEKRLIVAAMFLWMTMSTSKPTISIWDMVLLVEAFATRTATKKMPLVTYGSKVPGTHSESVTQDNPSVYGFRKYMDIRATMSMMEYRSGDAWKNLHNLHRVFLQCCVEAKSHALEERFRRNSYIFLKKEVPDSAAFGDLERGLIESRPDMLGVAADNTGAAREWFYERLADQCLRIREAEESMGMVIPPIPIKPWKPTAGFDTKQHDHQLQQSRETNRDSSLGLEEDDNDNDEDEQEAKDEESKASSKKTKEKFVFKAAFDIPGQFSWSRALLYSIMVWSPILQDVRVIREIDAVIRNFNMKVHPIDIDGETKEGRIQKDGAHAVINHQCYVIEALPPMDKFWSYDRTVKSKQKGGAAADDGAGGAAGVPRRGRGRPSKVKKGNLRFP